MESVGVTFVLGRNTPQLSSITIKIGGCPTIESKRQYKVMIEASDIECHVSSRVGWDKNITINSIYRIYYHVPTTVGLNPS